VGQSGVARGDEYDFDRVAFARAHAKTLLDRRAESMRPQSRPRSLPCGQRLRALDRAATLTATGKGVTSSRMAELRSNVRVADERQNRSAATFDHLDTLRGCQST
jgi:hypothetical protein